MRSGVALRLAVRDVFHNSWRLVPVNAALGAVIVVVSVATIAVHAALVLAVLAGPLVVALAHCEPKRHSRPHPFTPAETTPEMK